MSDMSEKIIKAAGGIIERTIDGKAEIVVIHRTRYGDEWSLPKGKVQESEDWEQAALREVKEETGFGCDITGFADGITYMANNVPKVVLFWKMKIKEGEFTPNEEVDQVLWLSPELAMEKVAYKEEADLLKQIYRL